MYTENSKKKDSRRTGNSVLDHTDTRGDAGKEDLQYSKDYFLCGGVVVAAIDYGVVVFKNGICQNWNRQFQDPVEGVGWEVPNEASGYAYAGDKHFTVSVDGYRSYFMVDGKIVREQLGCQRPGGESYVVHRMSSRFDVGGVRVTIKDISNTADVYWMSFAYREQRYDIVYGYGIDPNFKVWNRVKVEYLGRRISRKVDRLYHRIRMYS